MPHRGLMNNLFELNIFQRTALEPIMQRKYSDPKKLCPWSVWYTNKINIGI